MTKKKVRHILSLSGGKDSTALAIYLRDRIPDLEYVFCDTEKELPETYEYLARIEAYLGRAIVRLKHGGRGFDHHLAIRRGFLPSPRHRWCTQNLKLRPFEHFVGEDCVYNYIGIRADEDRQGYISHKPNITAIYPFVEDGITKSDVFRILENAGMGLPDYYKWRTRSGCYFCFFQQKIEWVGLLENHPDLFELAKNYEKVGLQEKSPYTWSQGESLEELSLPHRVAEIKARHAKRIAKERIKCPGETLLEVFAGVLEQDELEKHCLICQL